VLYRSHSQSLTLQMTLSREGIPFNITSGLRFSEQAHVKDMLAFLRVLINPLDRVSWTRILLMIPGVGIKTVLKIFDTVSTITTQPQTTQPQVMPDTSRMLTWLRHMDPLLPSKSKVVWAHISAWLRKSIQETKPAPLIEDLFLSDFFRAHLRSTYETSDTREDDLEQMQSFSSSYETLTSFLNDMSLLAYTEETKASQASHKYKATGATGGEKPPAVTLTTVHQAKGLEWGTVFVIGMNEGRFPSFQALDSPSDLEEERRLFYVAVTRAKQRLIITCNSIDPHSRTGNIYLKPSRFLLEVSKDLYNFYDLKNQEYF